MHITLENLLFWDMPNNAGNPSITGEELKALLTGGSSGFVTLDTVQTITGEKTFTALLNADGDISIDQGVAGSPLLSLVQNGVTKAFIQYVNGTGDLRIATTGADAIDLAPANGVTVTLTSTLTEIFTDTLISSTTESSSTIIGALVISGGVGVAKKISGVNMALSSTLNVDGIATFTDNLILTAGLVKVTHDTAGEFAGEFININTGDGVRITAGSTATESALLVEAFDGTDYFRVAGDGKVTSLGNITITSGTLEIGVFSATGVTDGFTGGASISASSRNTTASAEHRTFYNPNGQVGGISTSASTTVYATTSDPRLKTPFIKPVGALAILEQAAENDICGVFEYLNAPGIPHLGYNARKLLDIQPGYGGSEGFGPKHLKIGEIYQEQTFKYEQETVLVESLDENDLHETESILIDIEETAILDRHIKRIVPAHQEWVDIPLFEKLDIIDEQGAPVLKKIEDKPELVVTPDMVDPSKRVALLEAALYEMWMIVQQTYSF